MLMTGSLGMLASTLPVQALLPRVGWRGLFVALTALLALAMAAIARWAPRASLAGAPPRRGGYRRIMAHPVFVALAPLGFFSYGGLIAMQSLWAGPWLTQVAGQSSGTAAQGLFGINLGMLFAFLAWGVAMPRLAARGVHAAHTVAWGVPLSLLWLGWIVWLGPQAGALHWTVWCVLSTCVTPSQPFVAQAFAQAWAGRALSAFNLLIFAGVFGVQWGIGLGIEAFTAAGWPAAAAFRAALAAFGTCCALAYCWFLWRWRRMAIIDRRSTHR
jgi:predicted MFS family arabinose efflux permease